MRRREFITLPGGAPVAWPLAARAQQRAQMRRIGIMLSGSENDPERVGALRDGLKALGWIEGRSYTFEYRWPGGDPERVNREGAAEGNQPHPD
jgi:hypothetical protein